jgi:hypothetical protein
MFIHSQENWKLKKRRVMLLWRFRVKSGWNGVFAPDSFGINCRFFWKRLISFFLLCKNHLKNACFIWGLADFYISEKKLSGVFKKKNGSNIDEILNNFWRDQFKILWVRVDLGINLLILDNFWSMYTCCTKWVNTINELFEKQQF